jgi:ParB family chromosome partitioning protein
MDKEAPAQVVSVNVDNIIPDPDNLREHFDEEDIRTLADNILEHGQMDPIQVFEHDGGVYQIFDGERRWRACHQAGIKTMSAIVILKPSQEELISKRVSRAMQSRSLTPQEEVRALETALNALGVGSKPEEWSRVARKLGLSPQLLRDRMRIPHLTEVVRQQFEERELDLSAAQALGRIENPNRQEEVAQFIKENQLHTRFVGTKFIEKLMQYPDTPVLEVYTIAQSELREPGRVSHKPQKEEILADRLEDILADLRRAGTWLEASGKEGLLEQLMDRNDRMGLTRLVEEVQRLIAMCRAVLKHATEKERSADVESPKELPEAGSRSQ